MARVCFVMLISQGPEKYLQDAGESILKRWRQEKKAEYKLSIVCLLFSSFITNMIAVFQRSFMKAIYNFESVFTKQNLSFLFNYALQ